MQFLKHNVGAVFTWLLLTVVNAQTTETRVTWTTHANMHSTVNAPINGQPVHQVGCSQNGNVCSWDSVGAAQRGCAGWFDCKAISCSTRSHFDRVNGETVMYEITECLARGSATAMSAKPGHTVYVQGSEEYEVTPAPTAAECDNWYSNDYPLVTKSIPRSMGGGHADKNNIHDWCLYTTYTSSYENFLCWSDGVNVQTVDCTPYNNGQIPYPTKAPTPMPTAPIVERFPGCTVYHKTVMGRPDGAFQRSVKADDYRSCGVACYEDGTCQSWAWRATDGACSFYNTQQIKYTASTEGDWDWKEHMYAGQGRCLPPQPTSEPTEAPEPETHTINWNVETCCMTEDACKSSGLSVARSLPSGISVLTTCTQSDPRRRSGVTWNTLSGINAQSILRVSEHGNPTGCRVAYDQCTWYGVSTGKAECGRWSACEAITCDASNWCWGRTYPTTDVRISSSQHTTYFKANTAPVTPRPTPAPTDAPANTPGAVEGGFTWQTLSNKQVTAELKVSVVGNPLNCRVAYDQCTWYGVSLAKQECGKWAACGAVACGSNQWCWGRGYGTAGNTQSGMTSYVKNVINVDPTDRPTAAPTEQPTRSPTRQPTNAPTINVPSGYTSHEGKSCQSYANGDTTGRTLAASVTACASNPACYAIVCPSGKDYGCTLRAMANLVAYSPETCYVRDLTWTPFGELNSKCEQNMGNTVTAASLENCGHRAREKGARFFTYASNNRACFWSSSCNNPVYNTAWTFQRYTSGTPPATPTEHPTESPTRNPTRAPTGTPTYNPTSAPTHSPTFKPTAAPTDVDDKDWEKHENIQVTTPLRISSVGNPTNCPVSYDQCYWLGVEAGKAGCLAWDKCGSIYCAYGTCWGRGAPTTDAEYRDHTGATSYVFVGTPPTPEPTETPTQAPTFNAVQEGEVSWETLANTQVTAPMKVSEVGNPYNCRVAYDQCTWNSVAHAKEMCGKWAQCGGFTCGSDGWCWSRGYATSDADKTAQSGKTSYVKNVVMPTPAPTEQTYSWDITYEIVASSSSTANKIVRDLEDVAIVADIQTDMGIDSMTTESLNYDPPTPEPTQSPTNPPTDHPTAAPTAPPATWTEVPNQWPLTMVTYTQRENYCLLLAGQCYWLSEDVAKAMCARSSTCHALVCDYSRRNYPEIRCWARGMSNNVPTNPRLRDHNDDSGMRVFLKNAPFAENPATVTWGTSLCCMPQDKCQQTGSSVQANLPAGSSVSTTCSAPAGRRRTEGEGTWDVTYEITTTENAAGSVTAALAEPSTLQSISASIEEELEITVESLETTSVGVEVTEAEMPFEPVPTPAPTEPPVAPQCNQADRKLSCLEISGCMWSKGSCVEEVCENKANKQSCLDFGGCAWNQFDKVCEKANTQAECSSLKKKADCLALEWCGWNRQGKYCDNAGALASCSRNTKKGKCIAQDGCAWNKQEKLCESA